MELLVVAFYVNAAIAGALAFFLVLHFISSTQNNIPKTTNKKKSPPEAGGGWPIVGHLHLLGKLPHINLGSMVEKYGPIFTIRLGVKRAVVVSSWKLAKEMFTTYDVAVSSRPKFLAASYMGYDYAMFGFSPYGAYWRELRKLTNVELLSARRLELLKHVRVSEIDTSIRELYKIWTYNGKKDGCVAIEMKQWFKDLSLNVVLRMVAGKRYFGAVDVDEKEARRCQKAMRDFFHLLGVFMVADAIPYLRWLDIGGYESKMKETGKEMDRLVGEWLKEHRNKESGEVDFMDVMISIIDAAVLSDYDADTIIKSTCVSLIAGGSDTTAVMLIWALSLVVNNRHVLKKAQEELDIHVGKERKVKETDIPKLSYHQAIIKETLRLYPAGPLGGFREFTEDCTVGGYHIQKGTRLILNLWKLQRDASVWEDPLEFRPERFLSTHKDVDVKGAHFELIPFGAGRRICPGTGFGLQLLHLVLANLLHAFDFSTPSDEPTDMTESTGLTNCKATPLDVLISPRLSPSLY